MVGLVDTLGAAIGRQAVITVVVVVFTRQRLFHTQGRAAFCGGRGVLVDTKVWQVVHGEMDKRDKDTERIKHTQKMSALAPSRLFCCAKSQHPIPLGVSFEVQTIIRLHGPWSNRFVGNQHGADEDQGNSVSPATNVGYY